MYLKKTKISESNSIEEIIQCSSTDKNSSYIKKYESHIPCGYGYKVICIDNRFSKNVG